MDVQRFLRIGSDVAGIACIGFLVACGSSDQQQQQSPLLPGNGMAAAAGMGASMMGPGAAAAGMGAPTAGMGGAVTITGAEQTPMAGTAGGGAPTGGGQSPMGGAEMPTAGTAGAPVAGEGAPEGGAAGEAPIMPGAGGLPRADEMDVNQMGPYAFDSYTEGLDNRAYASSVMYYPTDASPPFAAVAFSPGFTATKEQYQDFLGELMASHGIAMLLTTPTTTGDFPQQRSEDLQAAVEQIRMENERSGSPLMGKLATDRICVTGHSMGGGGSLWAASALGDSIRCVMPLQPWQPGQSFSDIVAPTMFIAAQNDTVAGVASNARVFYDSIPDSVEKYYVEFAGASHFLTSNTRGSAYAEQSKYIVAFYKVFLEDDERYREILDGPADPALSDYLH